MRACVRECLCERVREEKVCVSLPVSVCVIHIQIYCVCLYRHIVYVCLSVSVGLYIWAFLTNAFVVLACACLYSHACLVACCLPAFMHPDIGYLFYHRL